MRLCRHHVPQPLPVGKRDHGVDACAKRVGLARALGRQVRVAAQHKALAGIVRALDLGQVALGTLAQIVHLGGKPQELVVEIRLLRLDLLERDGRLLLAGLLLCLHLGGGACLRLIEDRALLARLGLRGADGSLGVDLALSRLAHGASPCDPSGAI